MNRPATSLKNFICQIKLLWKLQIHLDHLAYDIPLSSFVVLQQSYIQIMIDDEQYRVDLYLQDFEKLNTNKLFEPGSQFFICTNVHCSNGERYDTQILLFANGTVEQVCKLPTIRLAEATCLKTSFFK